MYNNKIKILLLGITGHGKSSIGNFLLGQNAFKVYDSPNYGTGYTMSASKDDFVIVDTPRLLCEDNNKEVEHYKELIKFIKNMKELNAILIVINSQERSYSSDIKTMITMICNIFEYKTFTNIGFVFTKYYGKKKDKEKIRKNNEEFVQESKKIIEDFYGKKFENNIPYYFIDSNLYDPDDDSLIEREKILQWAKTLLSFNTQELYEKDLNEILKGKY